MRGNDKRFNFIEQVETLQKRENEYIKEVCEDLRWGRHPYSWKEISDALGITVSVLNKKRKELNIKDTKLEK